MRVLFVTFLLLCLCVSSWGACTQKNASRVCRSYGGSGNNLNCGSLQYEYPLSGGNFSCGIWGDGSNRSCTFLSTSISENNSYYTQYEIQYLTCDTQTEADSAACVQNPNLPQCPQCDSTKYTCETSTTTTQTTIANEDVTCFNGECYGGIYCEYVTENTTTCTNECGGITTETARFPMRYDGACNEETAPDEDQCSQLKCVSNTSSVGTFYHLFRNCKNRNLINGEAQVIPVFEGGGVGTCKNAGYKESDPNESSSADSTSIPKECFLYGQNCPSVDSTDYSSEQNRTPQNGCSCQPYDGLSHISQIVCPDGSTSVFFGSCDDFNSPPVSSSSGDNPPESSSSGSENPPASSGGESPTDWVKFGQGETMIDLLAQILTNTGKQNQQSINIQTGLSDYQYFDGDSDIPWNRQDSILVINPDSSGFGALRDSLHKALWSRVDTNNKILDTLSVAPWSGCPTLNILGGSNNRPLTQSGMYLKGITINFCDISGFNLVTIVSSLVVAFASIVGFFIGFAIFKNVSQ